jgi:glucosyl-3-phosphoglycerate synthase
MTRAEQWHKSNTFHHRDFSAARIADVRTETVTVCVPARECASTIGPIVECLVGLQERRAIDGVVVVDAGSLDGTADVAKRAGAEVHQEAALLPEYGPPLGKGDAMWRALSVINTGLVVFVDADTEAFGEHFVSGLLGPLVCESGIDFVKAFYRRPFKADGVSSPDGGGRVTELTARPLLCMYWPELAGFQQPLAGEMAGRRDLFERIPWACGYSVETALLLDVHKRAGLSAMAQVDLDVRQNAHQSLGKLGPMAYAVLAAAESRLEREGRMEAIDRGPFFQFEQGAMVRRDVTLVERPPMAEVRTRQRAHA